MRLTVMNEDGSDAETLTRFGGEDRWSTRELFNLIHADDRTSRSTWWAIQQSPRVVVSDIEVVEETNEGCKLLALVAYQRGDDPGSMGSALVEMEVAS